MFESNFISFSIQAPHKQLYTSNYIQATINILYKQHLPEGSDAVDYYIFLSLVNFSESDTYAVQMSFDIRCVRPWNSKQNVPVRLTYCVTLLKCSPGLSVSESAEIARSATTRTD